MYKRLGEILVDQGVINTQALQAALAASALYGRRVGEILVEQQSCTEQQIRSALAKQLGFAEVSLDPLQDIPTHVLRMIPADLAITRQILPLSVNDETGILDIALSDPADQDLLDELRFRTGHELRPMVAMSSEITLAIERFYNYTTPGFERARGEDYSDLSEQAFSSEVGRDVRILIQNLQSKIEVQAEAIRELLGTQRILLQVLSEQGLIDLDSLENRIEQELKSGL